MQFDQLKRRDFITLLASAAVASPLRARAGSCRRSGSWARTTLRSKADGPPLLCSDYANLAGSTVAPSRSSIAGRAVPVSPATFFKCATAARAPVVLVRRSSVISSSPLAGASAIHVRSSCGIAHDGELEQKEARDHSYDHRVLAERLPNEPWPEDEGALAWQARAAQAGTAAKSPMSLLGPRTSF
jgi:hypothetical protein